MVVFVLFFIMVHGGIYIYIIIHVASWVGWGLQSETRIITPIYARGSSHECPWSVPDDKSFVMCRWFPTWLPNNLLQTGYITSLNGLVWGNIYRKPLKNCWLKNKVSRCSLKPTHWYSKSRTGPRFIPFPRPVSLELRCLPFGHPALVHLQHRPAFSAWSGGHCGGHHEVPPKEWGMRVPKGPLSFHQSLTGKPICLGQNTWLSTRLVDYIILMLMV
jgi:hypothetical protein